MSARVNRSGRRLPLACSLSGTQQSRRQEEAGKLFEGCLRVDELEDGYELSFPGSTQWAIRLTEFIMFERGCCPFFAFELVFEPGEGPIRLRVRGPEGVKDLVAEMTGSLAG
jgi:hypothetical protein